MKTIIRILTWLKNIVLTIISLPAYLLTLIMIFWIIICELGKGKKGFAMTLIKNYKNATSNTK